MEKRTFTRIGLAKRADIRYDNQHIGGTVRNISLRGVFVQTGQRIPLQATIDVSVHHEEDATLDFRATVIRHDEDGLGIRIERMDTRSLAYLKELLETQCGCPETAMRETRRMVAHMIS